MGRFSQLLASLLLVSCAPRCGEDGRRNPVASTREPVRTSNAAPSIGAPGGKASQPLADIPLRKVIHASRDACGSPCPVFFDAISDLSWKEIEAGDFSWSFGDGAAADGYLAAHVFELPEGSAERIFEVTLVVQRNGISIARDSHAITVRPQKGRTLCVANSDFSGCPSNNSADHFSNVGTAWSAIRTGDRILFKRGDSFSGYRFDSTVSGPVQVGAFGNASAARPMISQTGGTWVLDSEWSVTDVDISGAGLGAYLFEQRGNDTLVMRSIIRNTQGAFVSDGNGYNFSTHKFVVNNVVTGMNGTNYIGGDYIAFIGNRIERTAANHHTIRIAGGNHTLVSGNDLISNVGHSSLTVRGAGTNRPGSDYVLVQDNLMMQWASVHPQNTDSNEWLRHVIWERNIHVPHDSQTSIQDGLSLNGDDMVIRNNIFHEIRRAIELESHPRGASSNIHIYQNTQFLDRDNNMTQLFVSGSSGGGVVVENNLAVLPSTEGGTNFISVGGSAFVDRNFGYTPGRTGSCQEPDGGGACADPKLENTTDRGSASFMRPSADSLAVDAAAEVPVSNDFRGTPRPQGNAADIGAIERIQ